MGELLAASAIRSAPAAASGRDPRLSAPACGGRHGSRGESSYEGCGTLLGYASATAGRGPLGHACLWCAPRTPGKVLLCGTWYAVWLSLCHCRTKPARVGLPLVGAAEPGAKRSQFQFGPACAGAPHQF